MLSYHSFAAGAAAYGVPVAALAARTYGVPFEVALQYLRRYTREGYIV
jgi:adenine/guanine phosphoribosyltransferase-like PRPP-binding protein